MDYQFQSKGHYKDILAGVVWLAGVVLGIAALVVFH